MKRMLTLLAAIALAMQTLPAQNKIWNETENEKSERLAWWTEARFGMFIHWGLYAQAARHEWVKKAKAAGMKYAVITTKHHEGFCMFDSKFTDHKITNTPYGKDIIKEWVDAFRAEGLGIGFYYSLIDWHHPEYTIDRVHPQSASTREEYDRLNEGRDMAVYREYLSNQLRELLTWKDQKQLLVLLIESVSKGGNLLLNVGPTARGTFDHRADQALEGLGEWMKWNARSIYGCTQAPDGFTVPVNKPNVEIPVIELFLK